MACASGGVPLFFVRSHLVVGSREGGWLWSASNSAPKVRSNEARGAAKQNPGTTRVDTI